VTREDPLLPITVLFGFLVVGGVIIVWAMLRSPPSEECVEFARIVRNDVDTIVCEGNGKVSHENTTQGLLLTCTCPAEEKKP